MILKDGKHKSYISFIWNHVVRIKSLPDKAKNGKEYNWDTDIRNISKKAE